MLARTVPLRSADRGGAVKAGLRPPGGEALTVPVSRPDTMGVDARPCSVALLACGLMLAMLIATACSTGRPIHVTSGGSAANVGPNVVAASTTIADGAASTTSVPESIASAAARTFPVTTPPGGNVISRVRAVDIADRLALTPLTAAAPASAHAWTMYVTYGDVARFSGGAGNFLVDPTTPVWVVTVEAPTATMGSPKQHPVIEPAYTVVLDAVNGQMIDMCVGCNTLVGMSGATET